MAAAAQYQQAGRHSQASQPAQLLISALLYHAQYLLGAHGAAMAPTHASPSPPPSTLKPDPAAESFSYPVSCDVRDLVTLEDVMEELQLGPNG